MTPTVTRPSIARVDSKICGALRRTSSCAGSSSGFRPAVVLVEGSGLVTPHAAAAEHYDLDILAYHKMAARAPAPLRHNCSWKANQAHPPPTVHHALGDLVWWFLAARPTDCSHTTRAETPLPAPLASVAERSMFVTCSAPLDYYASLPPGEPSLGTTASTV